MHAECRQWFETALKTMPARQAIVELGSRNVNGTLRDLFPSGPRYVGVDPVDGPDVDVVGYGEDYTPDFEPDTVLSAEALEHAPGAQGIVANALRILTPGGVLILSAATDPRAPHSGVDGGPRLIGDEYYKNISLEALSEWLRPFVDVTIAVDTKRGDIFAIAWKPR